MSLSMNVMRQQESETVRKGQTSLGMSCSSISSLHKQESRPHNIKHPSENIENHALAGREIRHIYNYIYIIILYYLYSCIHIQLFGTI